MLLTAARMQRAGGRRAREAERGSRSGKSGGRTRVGAGGRDDMEDMEGERTHCE